MRYLVVGTLPPPRLARTASLLAYLDELEGAGHEVDLVRVGVGSTSARSGGLSAISGADVLDSIARGARSHDRLVVQLEPGLVGSLEAGRGRRAASLLALGLVLALWKEVELRLESFDDLPGGVGGRAARSMWSRASRVVVPTEAQRLELHAQAGVPFERIEVFLEAGPADGPRPEWPAGELVSRDAVMSVVRRRAATDELLAGWYPSAAVSRMLAEAGAGPAPSPFGPFEPVVRYVYERPALREPARRVQRVLKGAARRS
jgi:hypothetical protein